MIRTVRKGSGLPDAVVSGSRNIGYTYDGNGNITKIQDSDTNAIGGTTKAIVYQYDELNRLIRENNQILNKTVVYSYDVGGNLVSEKGMRIRRNTSVCGGLREDRNLLTVRGRIS